MEQTKDVKKGQFSVFVSDEDLKNRPLMRKRPSGRVPLFNPAPGTPVKESDGTITYVGETPVKSVEFEEKSSIDEKSVTVADYLAARNKKTKPKEEKASEEYTNTNDKFINGDADLPTTEEVEKEIDSLDEPGKKKNNNGWKFATGGAVILAAGLGVALFLENKDLIEQQENNKALKNENELKEERIANQQQTIDQKNAVIANVKEDNAKLSEMLKNAQGRAYMWSNKLELTQDSLKRLQENYVILQDSTSTLIVGLNESVESLEDENTRLAETLGITQERFEEAVQEIDSTQNVNAILNGVVVTLTNGSNFPFFGSDYQARRDIVKFLEDGKSMSEETQAEINKGSGQKINVPTLENK